MKKQLRILLADDDIDDRYFFRKALNELTPTARLVTVDNGQKLMDYLSDKDIRLPDVIFLDLNLPCKNGFECLAEIKDDKRLKHIPVIIYSTCLQEEVADVLYDKGAHYYLKKGDYMELPRAISQILAFLSAHPEQPERNKFVVSLQEV